MGEVEKSFAVFKASVLVWAAVAAFVVTVAANVAVKYLGTIE